VTLNERPDHPDGVFVEDNIFFYNGTALITRPGAFERLGEIDGLAEEIISALNCPVASINEPGTLDGGDVLKIDDLILVGISSRTNESGFLQLKQFFEQAGARVEQIPVSGSLHLKSIITALPDRTVVYQKDRLPAETRNALTKLGLTLLEVPEEKGVNVIVLGENTVMVQASAQQTI
jgi:dimethylargininase